MNLVAFAVATGIGATLVMDLWAIALKRGLGIPSLDYALVGRWVLGFSHGSLATPSIGDVPRAPHEAAIGWTVHYGVGVLFAAAFLVVIGSGWALRPTLAPALFAGLVTVCAPLFVMQPAMGLGFAAANAPNPNVARLRGIVTHLVFGAGLYLAAKAITLLQR